MLIGRVIDDNLGDHPHPAPVRFAKKILKVTQRPICRMDIGVLGYVISVIAQRGWEKWKKPERGDAEVLQVIQLARKAFEIAHAVAIAVVERPDVQLVENRVLIPKSVPGDTVVLIDLR